MKKDDLVYVQDIFDACEKIILYTSGMTEDEYSNSGVVQDAVIRNIEIIGEAAKKLSPEFVVHHPEFPYKEMVTMRNKLIHEYDFVDQEIVWDTVIKNIPELLSLTQAILNLTKKT